MNQKGLTKITILLIGLMLLILTGVIYYFITSTIPFIGYRTFPTLLPGIVYSIPSNWHINQLPSSHPVSDKWWEPKSYIVAESPIRYAPPVTCGLPCEGMTVPSASVEIDIYNSNNFTNPHQWYSEILKEHYEYDGPNTVYKDSTVDDKPAYCVIYSQESNEACYVFWNNSIYRIRILATSLPSYLITQSIKNSVKFI